MLLKALAIVAALLLGSSSAYAQCSGNPAAGLICGNSTAGPTLPGWKTLSSLIDRNFGAPSAQGTILNRGPTLWGATASPSLGVNGGNSGALILNGSSTGSATIGVKAAAGNTTFNLPVGNGALNNVLITDGAGNTSWSNAGSGTVSSVGLALPNIFTVSGSPVTTTGTLTGTLVTQSANLVWAGPTTGAASAPTFRSLVGADLPNPAPTTLGGVQSFAAVSSQWIRQISTSGVPTASQPAFTDISGTLAPAQCPNPSASTLGCVESFAAVPHQWINSISTGGVPSSTQPNFTDLAGNATLAQLPSISNNSVLGNNSGGTAVPSTLSASNVLDFIATTQGDVLYRNASIWTALPPGTNGQVLTSGGASANPSWTTVTGTGTVTSIATNNGITGGTITTTGTIGLATITAGSVLANVTGGSAVPIANTPSSILDLIGSATGDILYRTSGSGWTVLAPGTNGQVLTQGASTPAWGNAGTLTNVTVAAGTGIGVTGTCNISTTGTCTVNGALAEPQGRLTLTANTPVMTATASAQTTLRYDAYIGNQVPYYSGSLDLLDAIASNEVTDAMVSAASAGQVVSGQIYDAWWVHGGTNRICLAMSSATGGGGGWASDVGGSSTSRGTGYTQLDKITRPYVTNKNSITNCFNAATNYGPVSANQGTYLGTVIASANGQITWSIGGLASGGTAGVLGVWNMYNRVMVSATVTDNGTPYNYTGGIRQARGSAGNQVSFVIGLQEDTAILSYIPSEQSNGGATSAMGFGVCLDSTSSYLAEAQWQSQAATVVNVGIPVGGVQSQIGPGSHFVAACENSDGSSNNQYDHNSTNTLFAVMRM